MKALHNISYGLFVITAKGEKQNGAIINTCIQVASSPDLISVAINKNNFTTEIIEKTGEFNVSILDETVDFETIKQFGFCSGRDVYKFEKFDFLCYFLCYIFFIFHISIFFIIFSFFW